MLKTVQFLLENYMTIIYRLLRYHNKGNTWNICSDVQVYMPLGYLLSINVTLLLLLI